MLAINRVALTFCCFLCLAVPVSAQILEEEDTVPQASFETDETSEDEALFNELFSEYSEEERDVTKIKTFDGAINRIAESIDKKEIEKENSLSVTKEPLPPLEGNMYIGITQNSFSIYQNAFKEPACRFTVTLKSNMNRDINTLALNLLYTKSAFAFIFRDVKAGESKTEPIRTMGDICYNLSGVPDIDIHKCKIVGAESKECAQRIEWSNNLSDDSSPGNNKF